MSRSLSRFIGQFKPLQNSQTSRGVRGMLNVKPVQVMTGVAAYSKRDGPPSDAGLPFKTVTKSRNVDDDELNSLEGEPNWELISRKHNRFYFPNSTGPAWQGDTSTVGLLAPLSNVVNFFKDDNADKSRLEFTCCQCPTLIRESLFELFPVRAVSQRDSPITIITLSYEGDIELGAAKFVLAARDISDRLLSLGYWADFLNPFSGRPYYVPKIDDSLYKQDHRFRGLNMLISKHNNCMVIAAAENVNTSFSGTVYTTAPNNYKMLLDLLIPHDFRSNID